MLKSLASRRQGAFGAGLWSFADQGLVSVASFLLTVLLARSLSAEEFGAFVLVYALLVFCANLQMSLITRPHNLQAATLNGEEYRGYTGAAAQNQLLLAAVMAILLLQVAGVATIGGWSYGPMLAALAAATFTYQIQEFLRQERYTAGRSFDAFVYDVISYGGQCLLLIVLWRAGALTAVTALLALAATSLASAVYGAWRSGIRPGGESLATLRRGWTIGRWIFGDNMGQYLSTQIFPVLAAIAGGPAAAGSYRVLQNVLAPTHVIFNAFTSFATPRAARAYSRAGSAGLTRFMLPAALLMGAPFFAYLLLVGSLGSTALNLVYGSGHGQNAALLWLLIAAYVVQYVLQAETIVLLSTGEGRSMFLGRAASIATTLTLGVWLTWRFGVGGAFTGVLAANLTMALAMAALLWQRRSHEVHETAVAEPAMPLAVGGDS